MVDIGCSGKRYVSSYVHCNTHAPSFLPLGARDGGRRGGQKPTKAGDIRGPDLSLPLTCLPRFSCVHLFSSPPAAHTNPLFPLRLTFYYFPLFPIYFLKNPSPSPLAPLPSSGHTASDSPQPKNLSPQCCQAGYDTNH